MKRSVSISVRGVVTTAVALGLSLLIVGSTVSPVARASGRAHAAAYYLLGDASNTGSVATQFTTASSGDAWSFTASGSSATTIVGNCPNGSNCWGVQGKGTGIGVYGTANGATASSSNGVQGVGLAAWIQRGLDIVAVLPAKSARPARRRTSHPD